VAVHDEGRLRVIEEPPNERRDCGFVQLRKGAIELEEYGEERGTIARGRYHQGTGNSWHALRGRRLRSGIRVKRRDGDGVGETPRGCR
jgi:hypothetical protein